MDIYVGNLAYATTDDGLKAAFAAYGEVTSARVVTDRMTGRSKGFGFVEMPNREQAQAAADSAVVGVTAADAVIAATAARSAGNCSLAQTG